MTDIDTYVAECARFRADVEKLIANLRSLSPEAVPEKAMNDDGRLLLTTKLGSALPLLPGEVGPTGDSIAYTAAGETVAWVKAGNEGSFAPMVLLRSREQISAAYREMREKVWWDRKQEWLAALRADVKELPPENREIVAKVRTESRRIEEKYGAAKLWGADPMENQGMLRALGWVLGTHWHEAADT